MFTFRVSTDAAIAKAAVGTRCSEDYIEVRVHTSSSNSFFETYLFDCRFHLETQLPLLVWQQLPMIKLIIADFVVAFWP